MSEQLQIDIKSEGSTTIISVHGDVDLSKSNELRSVLHPVLAAKPDRVVVDLGGVSFMDSSGVATLIEALQIAKRADIYFVLCSLTTGVRSIIELTRLDQLFMICDSREEAIGT